MVAEAQKTSSMIQWDREQQVLFNDQSRVMVVNWHRQKGKDFTASGKAIDDAMRTGRDTFIVSITQRQADATFAKCKQFARAYKEALKLTGDWREGEGWDFTEYDKQFDHLFQFKAREIILPNGARVVSLPGRDPDTLAGLTGNVIFTEFGLFPNGGYDHWRVVFPLTTRGYWCLVISTPRGKNTKFYELCSEPELYSYHFCDIYQSIEGGFVLRDQDGKPCDVETFKRLYGDDAGWQREYECQFTGDLSALFTLSMLQEAQELSQFPFDWMKMESDRGFDGDYFPSLQRKLDGLTGAYRVELGWDVARHGDLSSLWINLKRPGSCRTPLGLVTMKGRPFDQQRKVVCDAMSLKSDKGRSAVGCGDATGLGMDSNETLQKKYRSRWEPVTFSQSTKREMASLGRTAFDDLDQALPSSHDAKPILMDLYAMQVEPTGSGDNIKIVEGTNPMLPDSHCDIAWSLLLARKAGTIRNANTRGILLDAA